MKQIISQSATVVLSVSAALANLCSVFVVGTNRYDMEASVTSPSGVTEVCDIEDLGASQYSIKFIPKEMGIHTVSVKHRGMHIPGPWSLSVSYWLPTAASPPPVRDASGGHSVQFGIFFHGSGTESPAGSRVVSYWGREDFKNF